ncbi:hypothetical protein F511_11631 [Dorcoceras hygrometricum]|uniref:Uncharacterized protein n=1 Tax=Dorcoceras hygrometricum TaxID=472368 RepID=A0A2Z7AK67_9LAMI|nr:hypothetical protein F511_11631 [Dorcoceras hygrometricum]
MAPSEMQQRPASIAQSCGQHAARRRPSRDKRAGSRPACDIQRRQLPRGNQHFTVDCGRLRQSGPRPETGFLRQPALEGLTRSARTDSPRQDWPEQFSEKRGGDGGGDLFREEGRRPRARLGDGFGSGPTGPGPTDEHSVHPHHRDFIVTPIGDQIGQIDSVSKTEYYDLKNHFSEPQCKMTVLPLNIGKSRFDLC